MYIVTMKKQVSPTQKMLNTWAIIVIIWSFYRSYFKTDLPIWFDEFIAKPAIFLLPIYYFVTKVEKAQFWSAVDFHKKNLGKDILLGLLIGLAFIASVFFVYLTSGKAS